MAPRTAKRPQSCPSLSPGNARRERAGDSSTPLCFARMAECDSRLSRRENFGETPACESKRPTISTLFHRGVTGPSRRGAELKKRYENKNVDFEWKVALMDRSGLPTSHEQHEWFYRRSGTMMRSPFMLSADWADPELSEYLAPNCVAKAAEDLGVKDDRVRHAIAHAGLREGKKIGDWEVAAEVGAKAGGLDAKKLLERAKSPAVEAAAQSEHRRIPCPPGHAASHLRVSQRYRRSRRLFGFCETRAFSRCAGFHARRHRLLRNPCSAFRCATCLEFSRIPRKLVRESACQYPNVVYNFPSVRQSGPIVAIFAVATRLECFEDRIVMLGNLRR